MANGSEGALEQLVAELVDRDAQTLATFGRFRSLPRQSIFAARDRLERVRATARTPLRSESAFVFRHLENELNGNGHAVPDDAFDRDASCSICGRPGVYGWVGTTAYCFVCFPDAPSALPRLDPETV